MKVERGFLQVVLDFHGYGHPIPGTSADLSASPQFLGGHIGSLYLLVAELRCLRSL